MTPNDPAVPASACAMPSDDPVLRLPVRRWRDGGWQTLDDNVAAEVPVALTYNSIPHVVMMATPRDLEDLGVGFTVSESLVAHYGEVRGVALDATSGDFEVRVSVDGARLGEMLERRRNLTGRTGCGVCGAETVEDAIPAGLRRTSEYLTHPVFSQHRSETSMLRYLRRLCPLPPSPRTPP